MTEDLVEHNICPRCKNKLDRYDNESFTYWWGSKTKTIWECPKCKNMYGRNNE